MKISILTSLLILLSLAAQTSPVLKIKFDDIESGNIFLINVQKELTDTLSINDGKVTYEAKIAAPTFFYLRFAFLIFDRKLAVLRLSVAIKCSF